MVIYCDVTYDSKRTFNKKDILYFYEFKMKCNNILLLFIQVRIMDIL